MSRIYYDTHIHSCLSPCADDDMTPMNIAGMASILGLDAVALTDHNSCANCPAFFAACEKYGITPIAGMELSTAEDIHIVCLFRDLASATAFDTEFSTHLPTIKNRKEIFGNQYIMDENDMVSGEKENLLISASDLWLGDAVDLARSYGAHVHPAHIDREANGIISILGTFPDEYGFQTVEFNDRNNIAPYFAKYPSLAGKKVIVCSDAHRLTDVSEAVNALEYEGESAGDLSAEAKRDIFMRFVC